MNHLGEWSRNFLTFNVEKCQTMYFVRQNHGTNSQLITTLSWQNQLWKKTSESTYQWTSSPLHLLPMKQLRRTADLFEIIKRSFTFLNKEILGSFYLALVRPIAGHLTSSGTNKATGTSTAQGN
ncbi:hypothetical protein Pcinc_004136 [Petrolisthes cinctipes]|uniref:Uncharacterized protein n=1 Tax=Petrolisthes cinctipes TaxID=88211 RepID=A0AAE1L0G4_PETCI|nr:hypothetical protein Pcinc_004136 [Petrolisthes cinctipes]